MAKPPGVPPGPLDPPERDDVRVPGQRCPFCHDEVARGTPPEICPACHALHHAECWTEHGACSACGAEREASPSPPMASTPIAPALASYEKGLQEVHRETLAPHRHPQRRVTVFASRFVFIIGLLNVLCFSALSIWWGDSEFRLMCQALLLLGIVCMGLGVKFHFDAKKLEDGSG